MTEMDLVILNDERKPLGDASSNQMPEMEQIAGYKARIQRAAV